MAKQGESGSPGTATQAASTVPGPVDAATLPMRPDEEPWTAEEAAEQHTELRAEVTRLREEIGLAEEAITGLVRDSGEGAGDDQADVGSKNVNKEHEMALAANSREMLQQTEEALHRLETGEYGHCAVCGKPIGKARLQAFPRAMLCMEDKQRQERR